MDPLISIDMSEYMEKYAVSRLIGSPPGYVGYDEAGQLTEKVRRHPYSVILFDEIEKAHPDDEHSAADSRRGQDQRRPGPHGGLHQHRHLHDLQRRQHRPHRETGFNKTPEQISANKSMKALQEFLRPEFLGRVDEIITFRPLNQQDLEKIAALMLDEYKPGMEHHGIDLQYTPAALKAIVDETSTKFGARELRRTIRKEVEDPIAQALIEGRLGQGTTHDVVTLDAGPDGKPVLNL